MEFKRPAGATRNMGRGQEEFFSVWVRDEVRTFAEPSGDLYQARCMICCFEPTPDELVKLNEGKAIYLSIMGTGFPPISVTVGDPSPEFQSDDTPEE